MLSVRGECSLSSVAQASPGAWSRYSFAPNAEPRGDQVVAASLEVVKGSGGRTRSSGDCRSFVSSRVVSSVDTDILEAVTGIEHGGSK